MNIKEIVEGMTAPQVAQVIKDNFNEVDKDKANKTDLNKSISDLESVVEANKTDLTKKIDDNKNETDAKLSELGQKAEEGRLQKFSLIGNGAVQQYITAISGKIETAQTTLTVYHSKINVSESYTDDPAVYCRIYDVNGTRLLNQRLTYGKTIITIPIGGATFSVDFFASILQGSVVGAEYSVDIRYWFNSSIYEQVSRNANEIANVEHIQNYLDIAGLNNSEKLSPSYTAFKYIHINGYIANSGSNPMRMTAPIKMAAGDIILMVGSTLNSAVAAISLTDSEGNVIKTIMPGSSTRAQYRYWAENDCYVVLSYYTDNVDIHIMKNTVFKLITGTKELANLNFGVDGDSITAGNQWSYIVYQNLQFDTHHNVALGSATFADKALTLNGITYTPQDYDSADYAGMSNGWQATTDATEIQRRANNCSRVHIQKFISEVNAGQYPAPDLFVFAMGTNDGTIGSLEDALDGDDIESLSENTRRTMLGGARYAIQKIMQTYPNCRIFVSVPIQRADAVSNEITYKKVEALRQLCDALSVKCFNTYGECGICEKIESGAGPYLSDGLHPNDEGRKLMGAYLTKEIRNNMW